MQLTDAGGQAAQLKQMLTDARAEAGGSGDDEEGRRMAHLMAETNIHMDHLKEMQSNVVVSRVDRNCGRWKLGRVRGLDALYAVCQSEVCFYVDLSVWLWCATCSRNTSNLLLKRRRSSVCVFSRPPHFTLMAFIHLQDSLLPL